MRGGITRETDAGWYYEGDLLHGGITMQTIG